MIRPEKRADARQIAEHYDDLDWVYREIWGEHVHHGLWRSGFESPESAVEQMVWQVAENARIKPGDAVCDIGCGYGAAARLIAGRYAAQVTGITLSRVQYDHAVRHSGRDGTSFILGDWLSSGLPAAAFDAVIAIESVEHMTDKAACFREARRVLRPGGRFAFTTWLAGEGLRDWERRWLLEPICLEGRLPGIGTAAEYLALLADEGFAEARCEDLSAQVKRTWSVCIRRVAARLATDPRYRAYALSRTSLNREFALTLPRMWLAYETGALRYGLFSVFD